MAATHREVRLALVLNGGVSLAIWIGGVTREIDAARRTFDDPDDPGDTSRFYREINAALEQEVVVDVIGGASAGGINGVVLGASIFKCRALPNLRETWIGLGDFRALLRQPAGSNPPSLMKGDQVVLTQLRQLMRTVYGESTARWHRDLYVFITATDLFGYSRDFEDSTGRQFRERDHRRVFGFQHEATRKPPDPAEKALRTTIWLGDADAPELLARAARSSSSFPVAFEAHSAQVVDADDKAHAHWLVDGGILDNQPFNPVLDRIAVLPAGCPVKRVVMYVVPYVTEVGGGSEPTPTEATARQTYSAAGTLPRDLPKLLALERVTKETAVQRWAEETRARVSKHAKPDVMEGLAETLFESYRETRRVTAAETYKVWTSKTFRRGSGVLGQDPADDAGTIKASTPTTDEQPPPASAPWVPEDRLWDADDTIWRWGLSPAERAASWALLFLADAASAPNPPDLDEARKLASELVWEARTAKELLVASFREKLDAKRKVLEQQGSDEAPNAFKLATAAYASTAVKKARKNLQEGFRKLDAAIEGANGTRDRGASGYALRVQELLDFEVVQNAFSIEELQIPFPFTFIFASAGIRNSLNHTAETPMEKLAGMKLNHFAGFLKRSWRANDWLWGRLDGVEHVLRAILDPKRIEECGGDAVDLLAEAAFGSGEETEALERAWQTTLTNYGLTAPSGDAKAGFKSLLDAALGSSGGADDVRFKACRRALAARIQLRILEQELPRVAETARDDLESGSSQVASGAFWSQRVLEGGQLDPARCLELFREMHIGEESLADEASSRLVMDIGSHGLAVATAMFAGDRGGLPAAARGMLGGARGLTLSLSRLIRLLARAPAVGAAVFFVLVGLVVWAATARSTLVGALFPALAILAVVLGVAVLTLATSVFERSLAKPVRGLAFLLIAGVPIGFALTFRWPELSHSASGWLDRHTGKVAVTVAAVLGLVAGGIALVRLGFGIYRYKQDEKRRQQGQDVQSQSWRRLVMSLYRLPVVAALLTLATGFVVERTLDRVNAKNASWVGVAEERRGTILVLALLATLLLAALLIEVVVPAAVWLRWQVRDSAWILEAYRNALIAYAQEAWTRIEPRWRRLTNRPG
jgi:predicted acylesterase/phospholipase RssA